MLDYTDQHLLQLRYAPSLGPDTERLLLESVSLLSAEFPRIWRLHPPKTIESIDVVPLDRIGGEYGYGGSSVFVAALSGRGGSGDHLMISVPLLIKIVEKNTSEAEKLRQELQRYASIGDYLGGRFHAMPLFVYPSTEKPTPSRVLWSEFLSENIVKGLPTQAPRELRHYLETENWEEATRCVGAAYRILKPAHDQGSLRNIDFVEHYKRYLRLDKGWPEQLESSIGTTQRVHILGCSVTSPVKVFRDVQNITTWHGDVVVGPVHGDLHPRNVIVGDIQRATLIDFGWAEPNFHTIVDFVLMEISMKFFYLPWFVNVKELIKLETGLSTQYLPDLSLRHSSLSGAAGFIKEIRRAASDYIDHSDTDWFSRQYLLPLFLVTMGMFAYASKVTNLGYLLLSAGMLAESVRKTL